MDYKCIKKGWIAVGDFCDRYNKDKSNVNRKLKLIHEDDKEKIVGKWFVKEKKICELLKLDII